MKVTVQWGIPQETGRFSPHPTRGLRFTVLGPACRTPSGKRGGLSPDEEVHISARYRQLIAHLIKRRAIKLDRLMDDSVRINSSLLVRCSDLLES